MTIKQYQYIQSISGATDYEIQLLDYFKIDKSLPYQEAIEKLNKILTITPTAVKSKIKVNGKCFKVEQDFMEGSVEQFTRLDNLLAEENNTMNLHKLLAIYIRPYKWFRIEKYNPTKQEAIANQLLEMDMEVAQGLLLFFSLLAAKYMKNINIHYLNKMKDQNIMDHTKNI